jgi:hypothetical protein
MGETHQQHPLQHKITTHQAGTLHEHGYFEWQLHIVPMKSG